MTRFIELKAQSENIGTVQGKRPINLQVYGIIANFLIVVILLSVSIFKLSIILSEGCKRKSLIKKFKTSYRSIFID
jgi:hypothetical protein